MNVFRARQAISKLWIPDGKNKRTYRVIENYMIQTWQ